MTTELPIQKLYTNALDANKIEWIHIPNRTFRGKYRPPENLCLLPDIIFLYKGTLFMREVGVRGRHLDRKGQQHDRMMRWASQGADILIVTSEEGAMDDLENIGLIKEEI
jgi:hypothetical protein